MFPKHSKYPKSRYFLEMLRWVKRTFKCGNAERNRITFKIMAMHQREGMPTK